MDKKQSVYYECNEVISHRKQNRYTLGKGEDKLALRRNVITRFVKSSNLRSSFSRYFCKKINIYIHLLARKVGAGKRKRYDIIPFPF